MTPLDPALTPILTCKNGHLMTIKNTRIVTGGARQCRQCDKERAQAKRDRLRGDKPKFKKDPATFKAECKRGHSLTDEANINWIDTPWGKQKQCKACMPVRRQNKRVLFQAIAAGTVAPIAPSLRHKDFCKYGHPMEGENLYISPGGERGCKACRLAAVKRSQSNDHDAHLEYRAELRKQERIRKAETVKAAVIRLRGEFPDRNMLLSEVTKVLKATASR